MITADTKNLLPGGSTREQGEGRSPDAVRVSISMKPGDLERMAKLREAMLARTNHHTVSKALALLAAKETCNTHPP